jgi:hypothetical protein
MADTLEMFPGLELGRGPVNGGAARPIGRVRGRRPRPALRRSRPPSPTARALASLQLQLTAGFDALTEALGKLESEVCRLRREQIELPSQLLRRMTELERAVGRNELHIPARHSRRRPLG